MDAGADGDSRRDASPRSKLRRVAMVAGGAAALVASAAAVMVLWMRKPSYVGFSCKSDLELGPVVATERKGLCLDDTTFSSCASRIPKLWPNTQERVTSLRLFSPWKAEWPEAHREAAWDELKRYVDANDVKVLLGVGVSCSEEEDGQQWVWTKQLLQMLGPDRLMGLAIGNEMDLLFMKGPAFVPPDCMHRLWVEGAFLGTFLRRVQELDAEVPGFDKVPITTVWSTYCYSGEPFAEQDEVKSLTFFKEVIKRYGNRFVFSFNIYPYFDINNHLDSGSQDTCELALQSKVCFGHGCFTNSVAAEGRRKIRRLMDSLGIDEDFQLWVGESGWSFPMSSTTQPEMKSCPKWSSQETYQKNYDGWLSWNLTLDTGVRPADHVFFFTMRDSYNFGNEEHFGLIGKCADNTCKLQQASKALVVA